MRHLPLFNLHSDHPGLTSPIAATYVEAASVCLSRHHTPPVDFDLEDGGHLSHCGVDWVQPDVQMSRAWANEIDTTEAGAYGMVLAALKLESRA